MRTVIAKTWAEKNGLPRDAIERIFDIPGRYNIGRLTKWTQERDSLITHWESDAETRGRALLLPSEDMIEIYTAVTGMKYSAEELNEVATRSYNLLKALNVREGFTRKDDKFPERWFEPVIRHGETAHLEDYFGKRLTREDCERILDEFYDESGWDIELGNPYEKKTCRSWTGRYR